MMRQNKRVVGVSHLEGRLPETESILEKPCIFVGDCYLSKNSCNVRQAINCQVYKFYARYKEFDYGRQLGVGI